MTFFGKLWTESEVKLTCRLGFAQSGAPIGPLVRVAADWSAGGNGRFSLVPTTKCRYWFSVFKQEICQENRYFLGKFYFSDVKKIMYFLMLPNSFGNVQNFEHYFSIDCEIWRVEFGGAVQLSAAGEGDLLPFSHVSGHVRCSEVREQACSVTGVYLIYTSISLFMSISLWWVIWVVEDRDI